jgi:hypothetical protein
MTTRKEHWDKIYETKQAHEVSWTQQIPKTSLDFVHSFKLSKTAGKVIFGWVPKVAVSLPVRSFGKPGNNIPTKPVGGATGRVWGYICDNGASGSVSEWSLDDAQQTVGAISSLMGTSCSLIPYAANE